MSQQDKPRRRRSREDYKRGLPEYHDPTAGFGGATPARSALTLRAVLANRAERHLLWSTSSASQRRPCGA